MSRAQQPGDDDRQHADEHDCSPQRFFDLAAEAVQAMWQGGHHGLERPRLGPSGSVRLSFSASVVSLPGTRRPAGSKRSLSAATPKVSVVFSVLSRTIGKGNGLCQTDLTTGCSSRSRSLRQTADNPCT